jgi:hypothetical protein
MQIRKTTALLRFFAMGPVGLGVRVQEDGRSRRGRECMRRDTLRDASRWTQQLKHE